MMHICLFSLHCTVVVLCHGALGLRVLALSGHHLLVSPAPIKSVLSRPKASMQGIATGCSMNGFYCSGASVFGIQRGELKGCLIALQVSDHRPGSPGQSE